MDLDDRQFEDEVRRIARELWPTSRYQGSAMIDGRERDGVFITEDCVFLIECTTSRAKDKAENDCRKLKPLVLKMRRTHPTKAVKGYFITLNEPTADQRKVVETTSGDVEAVSFDQFRSRLIDAKTYLELRKNYAFGSMRDPETDNIHDSGKYIQRDIYDENNTAVRIEDIADGLSKSKQYLLLGDYGEGKSTSLREVFRDLASRYFKGKTTQFPVFLNLRDHIGQSNTAEALERHARNIGYPNPSHLVRAWRAGYIFLILDGFDELGAPGWSYRPKKLQSLRVESTKLVRDFISESPLNCGIAVSGRAHYFDKEFEMLRALGIRAGTVITKLGEFGEAQIEQYLSSRGWTGEIPTWFPSRPLLLGYLASKQLLTVAATLGSECAPAVGWDKLLDRIADRESKMPIGIDGETVRKIIERVASKARKFNSGLGPIFQDDLLRAFQEECGGDPDDKGIVLLQRLPGLGRREDQDGSRQFIDCDFADAARAGDVFRYVENPFMLAELDPTPWQCCLGPLGRDVVGERCLKAGYIGKKLSAALEKAGRGDNLDVLAADVLQVMTQVSPEYDGNPITISGVMLEELEFKANGGSLSRVHFTDCLFQRLEIDPDSDPLRLPTFTKCGIELAIGAVSKDDFPSGCFSDDCHFENFSEKTDTTSAILSSTLPLSIRVLLTVLRKLYIQSGGGRKHSALLRGLDGEARQKIDDVLRVLRQEGLVVESQASVDKVWLPVRRHANRVRGILLAPTKDPIYNTLK